MIRPVAVLLIWLAVIWWSASFCAFAVIMLCFRLKEPITVKISDSVLTTAPACMSRTARWTGGGGAWGPASSAGPVRPGLAGCFLSLAVNDLNMSALTVPNVTRRLSKHSCWPRQSHARAGCPILSDFSSIRGNSCQRTEGDIIRGSSRVQEPNARADVACNGLPGGEKVQVGGEHRPILGHGKGRVEP